MIKQIWHNKYARISLKIVGILTAIIFLLLALVAIYIESNKQHIIEKIRTQLSQAIKGDVTIKNIDVSFLSSFPYAGINVYNVSILDSQFHKPLLTARYVSCRINFLQIVNPHPKISKLLIANVGFHFFTDTTRYTNAYLLLKKDTAKRDDNQAVIIKAVELYNVNVLIEDATKHKR